MLLSLSLQCNAASADTKDKRAAVRPNVIYIIVDDMGIGDIEPYGQTKIRTPIFRHLRKKASLLLSTMQEIPFAHLLARR